MSWIAEGSAKRLGWAAAVTLLLASGSAHMGAGPIGGLNFRIVRVVDGETTIPGRADTFACLGQPHLGGGGRVAFVGGPEDDCGFAIWTWDIDDPATLTKRYGRGDAVPDAGTATFNDFSKVSHSYGRVAFMAQATVSGSLFGIYTDAPGSVVPVATRATPVPGGTSDQFFWDFGPPWIYAGEVVLRARARTLTNVDLHDGIYVWANGTLRLVANTATPVPGGTGTFVNFGTAFGTGVSALLLGVPAIHHGTVVFRGTGSNGEHGVYRADAAGNLSVIADLTTPIPDGTGTFTDFETSTLAANMDGDRIVFAAAGDSGQQGIYLYDNGSVTRLVDRQTAIPNSAILFSGGIGSQGMGFDNGAISFLAAGIGHPGGIFTTLGGELATVLLHGDLVDGKATGSFGTYGHGLDGNLIAINDGNYGGLGPANFVAVAYRAVSIDIRPGDGNNVVSSRQRGVIPVAVLSRVGLDAPVDVVPSSLRFGRTGSEASLTQCAKSPVDVNGDGRPDLVCHFDAHTAGFQIGDTAGLLKGKTTDDIPIEGTQTVVVR